MACLDDDNYVVLRSIREGEVGLQSIRTSIKVCSTSPLQSTDSLFKATWQERAHYQPRAGLLQTSPASPRHPLAPLEPAGVHIPAVRAHVGVVNLICHA